MTIEKAVSVLHDHSIDTMEKDGKVFAACDFTENGGPLCRVWDEVAEKDGKITVHGVPLYSWLGY